MRYHLLALPAPSESLPLAPPAWASLLAPIPNDSSLLAPISNDSSLLAPPAPSGGAWGDASPQTPAIRSSRVARGLDMGNDLRSPLLSMRRVYPWLLHTPPIDGRSAASTPARPTSSTTALTSTLPTIRYTVCLAGVWGEASPQAPPEARWTAGRSRGASQPWAGGARREAQAPPEGAGGARKEASSGMGARRATPARRAKETRAAVPDKALRDVSGWY